MQVLGRKALVQGGRRFVCHTCAGPTAYVRLSARHSSRVSVCRLGRASSVIVSFCLPIAAPVRLLAPLILLLVLLFVSSAAYDIFVLGNLTDKTILLAVSSLNVFIFAMLADMIDKRTGG